MLLMKDHSDSDEYINKIKNKIIFLQKIKFIINTTCLYCL